ncbi:hypothetical protein NPIL_24411, partial [Nephila pilipes]
SSFSSIWPAGSVASPLLNLPRPSGGGDKRFPHALASYTWRDCLVFMVR